MPKKTIMKKLPSVDNSTFKRGRKPKLKESKELSKEKLAEIKNTAPENVSQSYFIKQQKEMLSNALQNLEDVEKLQEKLNIIRVKYRTKYMEAEHVRKMARERIDKLLDIISDLKSELIKYAPDDILLEIQSRITEITNENNIGRKRAL